jgi:hypothetical protein
MPPFQANFTALEQAVLNAICKMHSTDRAALETQLATAKLRSRENTGAGFFTYFDVGRDCNVTISGERMRSGPLVKIHGLELGLGFILWIKDGFASCLEGYSYEELTTGIAFESVPFEIIQG